MLSFIPVGVQMEYIVHSRKWLTAPVRVFDNTCCFMSPHSGRKCRNSLWVSSPRGYEKFTLQARSIGGNRQTAACLITGSILISLFYLPPWIEAEGLTASDYFPRGAPVGSPRCWFWIIYSIIDFLANSQTAFFYQCYCVSSLHLIIGWHLYSSCAVEKSLGRVQWVRVMAFTFNIWHIFACTWFIKFCFRYCYTLKRI